MKDTQIINNSNTESASLEVSNDMNSNYLLWIIVNLIMGIAFFIGFKMLNTYGFTDSTGISYGIIIVFALFYLLNFKNTLFYHSELENLKTLSLSEIDFADNHDDLENVKDGLFKKHIINLLNTFRNNHDISISQETSLEITRNGLLRKEHLVQLGSNLMVTLGLIGTISGLIVAISGLESVMTSLENDGNTLLPGLQQALSGMGSAFYTTLFGAILGGFFLKLLHQASSNMADEIIDQIALKTEIFILPYLRKTPEQMVHDHLTNFESLILATRKMMHDESIKISEYLGMLQDLNGGISLFTEKLVNIEPQMNGVHLTELKNINSTLKERKRHNRPFFKKLFD